MKRYFRQDKSYHDMSEDDIKYRQGRRKEQVEGHAIGAMIGLVGLMLVLILITGSIIGVHVGQKIGQRLQGSQLKALLAVLMLSVGLLMAYETFFKNGNNGEASLKLPTNTIAEIGDFGNTIYNLSNQYPIVYGLSSIFIALFAGVLVSYIRRQISKRINTPKAI